MEAWLKVDPSRILEIQVVKKGGTARENTAYELARRCGVAVKHVDLSVARGDSEFVEAGWRARVTPFPYRSLSDLFRRFGPSLLVVLDHVQDPRNLGAVARSAAAAGVTGLIIPKDRAASVTPVVEATAAGACAYLQVARVVNLRRALLEIRQAGYWIVGLDVHCANSIFKTMLPDRLALVVGGEQGLSRLVRENVDELVVIPTDPRVESLNVSVATSIACFWWFKDRVGALTG
ncbi:MAG: 23S rRNA (guanosine-2'-O-)-methyltransferase RlmB [Candidatus Binatia bacterium]|nr:MAG: 23S rRNA (guanosine-2'-O-)-methyltransferase RlmB [Candidatus Binatia bacterium]